MNSNSNLMDQARLALSEARAEEAQALLINFIVREPEDAEAWLLLAEALTDATKKRECLERARAINPRNIAILHPLDQLGESGTLASNLVTADDTPLRLAHPEELCHLGTLERRAAAIGRKDTPRATAPDTAEEGNGQNHSRNGKAGTPGSADPVPMLLEADSNATAHNALQPLLEYGQAIAQAVMMTTEPLDTRNIGLELLKIMEEAHGHDPVRARRWAHSSGRTALVKYEKALTSMITGLPRDDPQIRDLRELRRRALDYLK